MTIARNLSFLAQGASSTGVLNVSNGGTGLTTLTANYIPYGNGTSAFSSSSNLNFNGTSLGVGLTSDGTGAKYYSNGGVVLYAGAISAAPTAESIVVDQQSGGVARVMASGASTWSASLALNPYGGEVLVGTTSAGTGALAGKSQVSVAGGNGIISTTSAGGGYRYVANGASDGGNYYYASFLAAGTQTGSIVSNGTTTSYNITSDRRLKSNIQSLTTAQSGPIIDALQPRTFTWTTNNINDVGFIADEVQAVIPNAVTGQPNATTTEEYEITPAVKDANDNVITRAVIGTRTIPVYQMVDISQPEMIAYLVTEVQSLRARLKAANIA